MVEILITLQDFQWYWKGCREKTSSSISGLHFGHWKAAAESEELSELHAMMTQMAFQAGCPLLRWCKGLQVILEKHKGRVSLDPESLQRIIDWLDLNAQFYGDYSRNRDEDRHISSEGEKALREQIDGI